MKALALWPSRSGETLASSIAAAISATSRVRSRHRRRGGAGITRPAGAGSIRQHCTRLGMPRSPVRRRVPKIVASALN